MSESNKPVILLNLPRDLGDCLFCAPAIAQIKSYADSHGMELLTIGAKHRRGWAQALSGLSLPWHDTAAAPVPPQTLARTRTAFNFDFYDHGMSDAYPAIPVYQPEKMEVVEKDRPQFGAGAVVGKKHIFDLITDCLRDAGVLKADESLPLPAMPASVLSDENIRATQKKFGIDTGEKYALIVPVCAANRPFKRWQSEKFSALAAHFLTEGITPVLVGGPAAEEKQTCAEIAARIGPAAKDICGQTSLEDIAALARGAVFTFGNDTGPTHIAAAGGAPVLTLYGYFNDPATWQSKTPEGNARPLIGPRIQDITLQTAVDAVRAAIRRTPTPKAPQSAPQI